jgi:DNA (cytosine-5)-methyltransferase 1
MRKLPVNKLHADNWVIVDNFAGGGGASTGIEMAIGRSPDIAINHDPEALAMHEANHPRTRHYATDVFEIDPRTVCRDKPVGLAWFSPDCTHHSKARGGKPIRERGKKSRALAWVVVKWAQTVRPRVILLENVEEFADWGPLIKTEKGFRPCPERKGQTFLKWVRALKRLGYAIEWRELRACDFGSPTTRKRLFVIARCDGQPITWPTPTHAKPGSNEVTTGKLHPWKTAASIIDWAIPCPSIFLTTEEAKPLGVKRPLAENTLKRIAAGLKRYVLENPKPFIVSINHTSDRFRGQSIDDPSATVTGSRGDAIVMPYVASPAHSKTTGRGKNTWGPTEPLPTITAANDKCLIAPIVTSYHGDSDGVVARCDELLNPLRTVDTQNRFGLVAPVITRDFGNAGSSNIGAPLLTIMPDGNGKSTLVQAFIAQHNGGMVGNHATDPLSTITIRGTQQQIVTASFLSHAHQGGNNQATDRPLNTITASNKDQTHIVRAFLTKYYSQGSQDQPADAPLHTVPTRERLGLVQVESHEFQIVDIGMRMLTARELFRAQGFPDSYLIAIPAADRHGNLRTLPKDAQVRMCGNSVCPQVAEALVKANCQWLKSDKPKPRTWQRQLANV